MTAVESAAQLCGVCSARSPRAERERGRGRETERGVEVGLRGGRLLMCKQAASSDWAATHPSLHSLNPEETASLNYRRLEASEKSQLAPLPCLKGSEVESFISGLEPQT